MANIVKIVNIFKCILLNEKFYILFQISLKFSCKGMINNSMDW